MQPGFRRNTGEKDGAVGQAVLVGSAPGRCGIIGNPTDMYGGSVISCSLGERAYVSVEPADELSLESDQERVVVRHRADLQLAGDHCDILRAVIAHQRWYGLRARVRCWSDVPFASGLSSSTAMVAAALRTLAAYQDIHYEPHYFAEVARSIELNYLGVVCGYQDQYMATFGHLNYLDFRDKEFYRPVGTEPYATVEPLAWNGEALPFILANTGIQHSSHAVHKPIRDRWLEGDRAVVEGYEQIAKLAREGKRAFLTRDWEWLGRLMNDNHEIQRDLGGSGPENERLIAAALDAGALGAKLAGAGQGGTIIALHPRPEELVDALRAAEVRRILWPRPVPGVRIESSGDDAVMNAAVPSSAMVEQL